MGFLASFRPLALWGGGSGKSSLGGLGGLIVPGSTRRSHSLSGRSRSPSWVGSPNESEEDEVFIGNINKRRSNMQPVRRQSSGLSDYSTVSRNPPLGTTANIRHSFMSVFGTSSWRQKITDHDLLMNGEVDDDGVPYGEQSVRSRRDTVRGMRGHGRTRWQKLVGKMKNMYSHSTVTEGTSSIMAGDRSRANSYTGLNTPNTPNNTGNPTVSNPTTSLSANPSEFVVHTAILNVSREENWHSVTVEQLVVVSTLRIVVTRLTRRSSGSFLKKLWQAPLRYLEEPVYMNSSGTSKLVLQTCVRSKEEKNRNMGMAGYMGDEYGSDYGGAGVGIGGEQYEISTQREQEDILLVLHSVLCAMTGNFHKLIHNPSTAVEHPEFEVDDDDVVHVGPWEFSPKLEENPDGSVHSPGTSPHQSHHSLIGGLKDKGDNAFDDVKQRLHLEVEDWLIPDLDDTTNNTNTNANTNVDYRYKKTTPAWLVKEKQDAFQAHQHAGEVEQHLLNLKESKRGNGARNSFVQDANNVNSRLARESKPGPFLSAATRSRTFANFFSSMATGPVSTSISSVAPSLSQTSTHDININNNINTNMNLSNLGTPRPKIQSQTSKNQLESLFDSIIPLPPSISSGGSKATITSVGVEVNNLIYTVDERKNRINSHLRNRSSRNRSSPAYYEAVNNLKNGVISYTEFQDQLKFISSTTSNENINDLSCYAEEEEEEVEVLKHHSHLMLDVTRNEDVVTTKNTADDKSKKEKRRSLSLSHMRMPSFGSSFSRQTTPRSDSPRRSPSPSPSPFISQPISSSPLSYNVDNNIDTIISNTDN